MSKNVANQQHAKPIVYSLNDNHSDILSLLNLASSLAFKLLTTTL